MGQNPKISDFFFLVPNGFLYGFGIFWGHFGVPAEPAKPAKPANLAEPAKPAKPAEPAEPAKPAKLAKPGSHAYDHYSSKALVGTQYPFEL